MPSLPSRFRQAPCAGKWRSSFMPNDSGAGLRPAFARAAAIGLLSLSLIPLKAQPIDLSQALSRLDSLEKQNQELTEQIRLLREQLSAVAQSGSAQPDVPAASVSAPEREEIQERRIAELDQSRVATDHRL